MQQLHCVSKNVTTFSMISWTRTVRLQKIVGALITKSVGHQQVFLVSHLTYIVQLLYLAKLSRPKYHEFSLKLVIFSMLQYTIMEFMVNLTGLTAVIVLAIIKRSAQLKPRQCLWCCHHGRAIARVHPVHLMNVERRQVAADPRPSQTTYTVSPPVQAARVYTHHRHLLLLLSPKADTHFTIPQRVEGWVNLAGWLHTNMVYPSTDGHPSWY